MRSKNWPNAFAPACALPSLLFRTPRAAQLKPAIVLIDAGDAAQWQAWTREAGWQVITGEAAPNASIDTRVQTLAAAVETAIHSGGVDPAHVYIAGRGEATAAVFYAISRVPDLWAAGVAIGGSPKAALDTNRIFTANFTLVPLLWLAGEDVRPIVEKLTASQLNVEWKPLAANSDPAAVLRWLLQH